MTRLQPDSVVILQLETFQWFGVENSERRLMFSLNRYIFAAAKP